MLNLAKTKGGRELYFIFDPAEHVWHAGRVFDMYHYQIGFEDDNFFLFTSANA